MAGDAEGAGVGDNDGSGVGDGCGRSVGGADGIGFDCIGDAHNVLSDASAAASSFCDVGCTYVNT